MTRDVTAAGEQLADAIAAHVRDAVALERDRQDAELEAIRERVQRIEDYERGSAMRDADTARRVSELWANALHSVKVQP